MRNTKKITTFLIIIMILACTFFGLFGNYSYAENVIETNSITNTSTEVNTNSQVSTGTENIGATNSSVQDNSSSTQTNNGVTSNKQVTNVVSKSSNANLSNLGIKPNDFKGFKSDKTSYDVEVPNDVEEIEVYAKLQDNKSTIQGTGKKKLEEGLNTLSVVVTAEDGTTKTYMINVTRGEGEVNPNNSLDGLSELKIENATLNPSFKTDIYEYTAKYIGEATELNIQAIATDTDFSIDITGNKDLVEGENLITILVSDPDGKNVATYQVTVKKSLVDEDALAKQQEEAKRKENEKKKFIIYGVIGFVLLVAIVFFIIRYRKNRAYVREYEESYDDEYDDYDDYDEYENDEYYNEEIDDYEDEELSKADAKKKFLENYNSFNQEEEYKEEKPKRRHKGKRFK